MQKGENKMKITIINGSPKAKESNSEILINALVSFFDENDIAVFRIQKAELTEPQFDRIQKSDALIFAFPLYVDGIPSHLLWILTELEKKAQSLHDTKVYCMINNGFYEGRQNRSAVLQMKNWCCAAGLSWGQAAGIGAGEMLPFLKDIPPGHGPVKNTGRALKELALHIEKLESGKDMYLTPNWPRFLWRIQGTGMWYSRAKKNGRKKKDLFSTEMF